MGQRGALAYATAMNWRCSFIGHENHELLVQKTVDCIIEAQAQFSYVFCICEFQTDLFRKSVFPFAMSDFGVFGTIALDLPRKGRKPTQKQTGYEQ